MIKQIIVYRGYEEKVREKIGILKRGYEQIPNNIKDKIEIIFIDIAKTDIYDYFKDINVSEYQLLLEKEETIILRKLEENPIEFKSINFIDYNELKEYNYIDTLKEEIYESTKTKIYKITSSFNFKYFDDYIETEEVSIYKLDFFKTYNKDVFVNIIDAKKALLDRYKKTLEYKKDTLERTKEKYEKEIKYSEENISELEESIKKLSEELESDK